jgi:hypothetical protein
MAHVKQIERHPGVSAALRYGVRGATPATPPTDTDSPRRNLGRVLQKPRRVSAEEVDNEKDIFRRITDLAGLYTDCLHIVYPLH